LLAEVGQMGERCWTAGIARHEGHILGPKGRIRLRSGKRRGKLVNSLVENFWNKGPAEGAVVPRLSWWALKEFVVHAGRGPSLVPCGLLWSVDDIVKHIRLGV